MEQRTTMNRAFENEAVFHQPAVGKLKAATGTRAAFGNLTNVNKQGKGTDNALIISELQANKKRKRPTKTTGQRNTRQRKQADDQLTGSQPSAEELSGSQSSQQTDSSLGSQPSSQSSCSQGSIDDSAMSKQLSSQVSDDCILVALDDPEISFQSKVRVTSVDSGVSLQTVGSSSAEPVLECAERLTVASTSSEDDLMQVETAAKAKKKALAKPRLTIKISKKAKKSVEVEENSVRGNNKPKKDQMICALNWDPAILGERFAGYEAPPEGVDDPDRAALTDPNQSALFAHGIFLYYRSIDQKFRPEKYLEQHPELNHKMRSLLVDWMVEVQETMELNHETLYVAVRLVDLHLSRCSGVLRHDLQLIGCSALILSAKMDDRLAPPIDDYVYAVDDAYTKAQIMRMEQQMLVGQKWELGIPTAYRVLRRYSRVAQCEMNQLTLARYILESSLLDYDLSVSGTDHELAAGCLYLSMRMMGQLSWNRSLEWHTGFTESTILPMASRLNANVRHWQEELEQSVQTIFRKYSHHLFHGVAKLRLLTEEQLKSV